MDESQKWKERIECPSCHLVQMAELEWPLHKPWPIFSHECECGYLITESEWLTPDEEEVE